MQIDGVTYEFTWASDLERDGMSLECVRVDAAGGRTLVLEAFWHDPTGRFSVWSCGEELPYALVRAFLGMAAEACPPIRSDEAGTKVLIHVPLLDEGVLVWRPVTAEVIGIGRYRITGREPDGERWKFATGTSVRGEERRFDDGPLGLVATRRDG